ncbi:MAG: hypothetical protein ACLURV_00650 [Gallintestinimicrobium sp.]
MMTTPTEEEAKSVQMHRCKFACKRQSERYYKGESWSSKRQRRFDDCCSKCCETAISSFVSMSFNSSE